MTPQFGALKSNTKKEHVKYIRIRIFLSHRGKYSQQKTKKNPSIHLFKTPFASHNRPRFFEIGTFDIKTFCFYFFFYIKPVFAKNAILAIFENISNLSKILPMKFAGG